jgi:hypothetical protein
MCASHLVIPLASHLTTHQELPPKTSAPLAHQMAPYDALLPSPAIAATNPLASATFFVIRSRLWLARELAVSVPALSREEVSLWRIRLIL